MQEGWQRIEYHFSISERVTTTLLLKEYDSFIMYMALEIGWDDARFSGGQCILVNIFKN